MQAVKARFPRSARLLKPAEFSRVFDRPKKSVDEFFTVLFRAGDLEEPRLGLAISKKNVRRAVDRNLIKRLIRESFRLHQHTLGGLDIVVMARRNLPFDDRAGLRHSLDKHWSNLVKRSQKQ
ncbi:MAG: ribonuclease P protein component [Candidatus Sedimenticola sp. 20ELBAFRAG]